MLIIVFVAGFAALLYLGSSTAKGARGEARVRATLTKALDQSTYHILNDITLPAQAGTTQIDHIVVSRYGIFVIETKNMAGWIYGDADQSQWTQVLRRYKARFQNPLRQNYKHIKAVQGLLDLRSAPLHNLVVFVGSATPKTAMPETVFWRRKPLTTYINSMNEVMFTDAEVRNFTQRLKDATVPTNRQTRRDHNGHLKAQAAAKQNDPAKCPRCAAKLVSRANAKTGEKFLGCSRYPHCRGTRKLA